MSSISGSATVPGSTSGMPLPREACVVARSLVTGAALARGFIDARIITLEELESGLLDGSWPGGCLALADVPVEDGVLAAVLGEWRARAASEDLLVLPVPDAVALARLEGDQDVLRGLRLVSAQLVGDLPCAVLTRAGVAEQADLSPLASFLSELPKAETADWEVARVRALEGELTLVRQELDEARTELAAASAAERRLGARLSKIERSLAGRLLVWIMKGTRSTDHSARLRRLMMMSAALTAVLVVGSIAALIFAAKADADRQWVLGTVIGLMTLLGVLYAARGLRRVVRAVARLARTSRRASADLLFAVESLTASQEAYSVEVRRLLELLNLSSADTAAAVDRLTVAHQRDDGSATPH